VWINTQYILLRDMDKRFLVLELTTMFNLKETT
jgi:hypothetical protein